MAEVAEAGEQSQARQGGASKEVHTNPARQADASIAVLLWKRTHLVSRRDILEALLRIRLLVDVWVELAGQLAVGALDRLLVCSRT
jgi:hypothetical protein